MSFSHIIEFLKNIPAIVIGAACIGISIAAAALAPKILALRSKNAFEAQRKELARDIVHLFVLPRGNQIINISAPCVKVEAFLRLYKLPYTISMSIDVTMSPSDRIPVVVYNGECCTDSNIIISFLKAQLNINENLSQYQEVEGHMVTRLAEQTISKGLCRSFVVDNYNGLLKAVMDVKEATSYVLGENSGLLRTVVETTGVARLFFSKFASMIRDEAIFSLNTEGYGDLLDDQYHMILQQDLDVVVNLIVKNGNTFILGGSVPTSFDCGVFNILEVFRCFGLKYTEEGSRCPPFEYLCKNVVLEQYCDRVRSVLFPDFKIICDEASMGVSHQEFLNI